MYMFSVISNESESIYLCLQNSRSSLVSKDKISSEINNYFLSSICLFHLFLMHLFVTCFCLSPETARSEWSLFITYSSNKLICHFV